MIISVDLLERAKAQRSKNIRVVDCGWFVSASVIPFVVFIFRGYCGDQLLGRNIPIFTCSMFFFGSYFNAVLYFHAVGFVSGKSFSRHLDQ